MFEQAFKESTDIQTCEIACAKPKIKGQAPSFGGHRKTTEGRNSVLLREMVKERGLPLGGPGTSDIRNKQMLVAMGRGPKMAMVAPRARS
jgi:hypothetical protein